MPNKTPRFIILDDEGATHTALNEKELTATLYCLHRQGASCEVYERREYEIDVKVSLVVHPTPKVRKRA